MVSPLAKLGIHDMNCLAITFLGIGWPSLACDHHDST